MSTITTAEALYGPPAAQEQPTTSILGYEPPAETPQTPEQPAHEDKSASVDENPLYREGGDVPDTFGPIVNPTFEHLAKEARIAGDQEEADVISTAARELGAVFTDFAVGSGHARKIMSEVSDFLYSPRSVEASNKIHDNTVEALQAKYGDNFDNYLKAANRVIQEAAERIPNLNHNLKHTGLGNSQKLVEICITVAKRKGYIR